MEPYGHAVPAPNLRRLAEEGVLFRQAFATNPTCSPSRASFLTGMHPHVCGMFGLGHRGFAMDDERRHAAHHFKAHGYVTALAGVEHTSPDPRRVGYGRALSALDTNYPDTRNDPPIAPAAAGATRPSALLPLRDDSPSKEVLLARGWRAQPRPREMLFDLAFDPDETCNRVDDPALASVLSELRGRLERWMRETSDPLLDGGDVPAPAAAMANDPAARSPQEPPRSVHEAR